jgi:ABC-2 type transport system permease protein
LNRAVIAVVDEDQSGLSRKIISAFYPPYFMPAKMISLAEMDPGMDSGRYTFVLNIPPNFARKVSARRSPTIQLNVDATRMSQAFTGSGYVQQIVLEEVNEFVKRHRSNDQLPAELVLRARFNPTLTNSWFGPIMELINAITMLSIILTGAALIREREHGTIEHLLVMPITPEEIMFSKVWSMGLIVLVAAGCSLTFVIQGLLKVPIEGSVGLFLVGALLHLFATTSMAIFLATVARSMSQFGLLIILILLPLQMLSGAMTPQESMPSLLQNIMLIAPTTHFVSLAQAILYRGADFAIVWKQFFALLIIGALFFTIAMGRFRRSINNMA